MAKLVTFVQWRNDDTHPMVPVTINPAEVSSVEDYCGDIRPGSQIIMRNNKSYLVAGFHEQIIAKLNTE